MARNFKEMKGTGGKEMQAPLLQPDGYPARLVGITFLGVQKQRPYKGQDKPPHDMVMYTYELSHEFMQDKDGNVLEDKPRWFSEEMPVYGPEADKAKLTKRNNALDPGDEADGNPRNLLGRPCSVVVVHNAGTGKHAGRTFENVGDVTTVPKMPGYQQPDLVNPTRYFDPQDDECTLEEFRALNEFVQKKILAAQDFPGSHLAGLLEDAPEGEEAPKAEAPAEEEEADADNPY